MVIVRYKVKTTEKGSKILHMSIIIIVVVVVVIIITSIIIIIICELCNLVLEYWVHNPIYVYLYNLVNTHSLQVVKYNTYNFTWFICLHQVRLIG